MHASSGSSFGSLWYDFLRGGYPEPVTQPERDVALWYASYIQTYLERDVRSIRQVGDLTQFQNLLRVLAARSGQLLNLADVARDLGVALNTVKAWLSVLEAPARCWCCAPTTPISVSAWSRHPGVFHRRGDAVLLGRTPGP